MNYFGNFGGADPLLPVSDRASFAHQQGDEAIFAAIFTDELKQPISRNRSLNKSVAV
ncbi:hypothetical protein MIB92_16920 [Aestuariirhabdus sp. Z084]|uniref:hypothetical protein n=1 Tax=Aestuariirhabdus haliotis TaxID=2918751 RepID=UPI00201B3673|nr:hypothetical protein [Aestuariirhabdus haliotis]MCL6417344.1 hypothetical protein [Aestuariirhabdus haliotis]MCL6421289.1 hypothetical protein [Aestuariirhabdus haliotis]